MIKVGDLVIISPAHSVKFGGWCGRVVAIEPEDGLPVKVKFNEQVYGFDFDELGDDVYGKN
ncbi:hypothetical protein SAMN05446037_1006158 [Anaerovirgula multivorans]|uniref:Uncharacterized protein n=1 Tax=Anaerovirgula multivorans TaxID=312168 RepID=A0A239CVP4_9FIRM|nr:hypothetical protein [Anaerovirgula multivorans]SNS23731.1 hypothetical protein SAMN05446037_1006158 [Anaerovirgula multivorans]